MEPSETGESRWVPAFVLGGEATIRQRARNLALYQTLRDRIAKRVADLLKTGS